MKRPPLAVALVVLPVVVLAVLHLAGARQYLGVLSGTRADGIVEALLGVAYALAWLGTLIVAPIVLLASLIEQAAGRISGGIRAWRAADPFEAGRAGPRASDRNTAPTKPHW